MNIQRIFKMPVLLMATILLACLSVSSQAYEGSSFERAVLDGTVSYLVDTPKLDLLSAAETTHLNKTTDNKLKFEPLDGTADFHVDVRGHVIEFREPQRFRQVSYLLKPTNEGKVTRSRLNEVGWRTF